MSRASTLTTINQFLQQVKTAAEANTEPGSIGGETSHPVKDVDDSTQDAEEGERSAENEADVKKEQGKPGVDSTPENIAKKAAAKKAAEGKSSDGSVNPPGTAAEDQLQIGTNKQPTGEDPSVETQSVKAEKEDSETSHPARTNNSELDDFKYASYSIEKLEKMASDLGNFILAAMAEDDKPAKKAADKAAPTATKEAASDEVDLAGAAGYELAGLVSGDFDKKAADAIVQQTIEEIIKTASDDADKVAVYLYSFHEEQQKQAAAASKQRVKRAEGPMPPVDPAMMAGGGAPPAGGGDPAAMMGGGAPPMGGEGGGEEDIMAQLAQLIQSGQLPPEVLEQLAAALGGGGGAPPEGAGSDAAASPGADEGGPAPDAEDTTGAPEGMEVSAAVKVAAALLKSAAAKKTKAPVAKQQKSAKDTVLELISRSKK